MIIRELVQKRQKRLAASEPTKAVLINMPASIVREMDIKLAEIGHGLKRTDVVFWGIEQFIQCLERPEPIADDQQSEKSVEDVFAMIRDRHKN